MVSRHSAWFPDIVSLSLLRAPKCKSEKLDMANLIRRESIHRNKCPKSCSTEWAYPGNRKVWGIQYNAATLIVSNLAKWWLISVVASELLLSQNCSTSHCKLFKPEEIFQKGLTALACLAGFPHAVTQNLYETTLSLCGDNSAARLPL